ncbi:M protein repeat protein [Phlyctema vagabunda]|uniref:M protein repeat protein n=1 Tax=Phlyctema vagabunda TaxID=108571 RepID=A0ABR4PBT5_9HELO
MAAPTKQASRWGSFLQQAVAGVESRLDNILAEGDEANVQRKAAVTSPVVAPAAKSDDGLSRSASTNSNTRTNDRLQERLARAVAAKNAAQKADLNTSSIPSRTASPILKIDTPRSSIDSTATRPDENKTEPASSSQAGVDPKSEQSAAASDGQPTIIEPENSKLDDENSSALPETESSIVQEPQEARDLAENLKAKLEVESSARISTESTRSSVPRGSTESARNDTTIPRSSTETLSGEIAGDIISRPAVETEAILGQLQSDFERAELQRQEEIHGYVERIDALQAKLQYLSKESAETARKAVTTAPAGSLEKKLAEKDEQVALLMSEGQQLSGKEMKYLTTIKKLRAKQTEDNKEITEAKKKQEKAEHDSVILLERLRRAEASEKRLSEKTKLATQLQKDVDTLRFDRDSKDTIIADLRSQLEAAIAEEKEAEAQAANEALDLERKRARELEDNLANAEIEKKLVADRGQAQLKELREKLDMEAERSRIASLEAKNEQQMLESKLEMMRARAEEVSSGATGDAQAKLLRQIETLQTQYSVASENWQGIEATLIARVASLEKERDEATRRETDIRKKAREVTMKAKRNEEELEDARTKIPTIQQELAEHKTQLESTRRRAEEAEQALAQTKAGFERERQGWKAELQQRIEEESQKMQDEVSGTGSIFHGRAESPLTSSRKGLTSEFLGLQNLQTRRASTRSINGEMPPSERFMGRRPSVQPIIRSSGRGTPSRQDSVLSLRTNGEVPDTPSIHTMDHDDFFGRTESPTSPNQTINDMVSASTAAAGPTVQLVERMSSAVRRLESEKVATKEDLARLSAQRDEARAQIVALMREVEVKRASDSKVAELEAENKDINARYQTTLEMLGEKSEQVDELRSDIDDIKAMYRELVERTVK